MIWFFSFDAPEARSRKRRRGPGGEPAKKKKKILCSDLRDLCRAKGLNTSGKKDLLTTRLGGKDAVAKQIAERDKALMDELEASLQVVSSCYLYLLPILKPLKLIYIGSGRGRR